MKQTYQYYQQKHINSTTPPNKRQNVVTQAPINQPNSQKRRIKTSAPSNQIKQIQIHQRYKIIVGSKSVSFKQTSPKFSKDLQNSMKRVKRNESMLVRRPANFSVDTFSISKHTWKSVLNEQKSQMSKLEKLRNENSLTKDNSPLKDNRSSIRYNTPQKRKHPSKIKPQLLKLRARPLESYKAFICSSLQCTYNVGFNFNYLRNLSRKQIQNHVNFKDVGFIESLQLCALDILESGDQRRIEADNNLLREYCVLYFKQFQKNLIEFTLLHHYYKIDQEKIFGFFLNTRIVFYALHQISLQYLALENDYKFLVAGILKKLIGIQKLIWKGRKQICEQGSYVNETLKLLKITSELQKLLPSFGQNVDELIGKSEHIGKLQEILKDLRSISLVNMPDNLFQCLIQHEVCLSWNFLCVPPIPHLPLSKKKFTLVLGIQGVLVHYDQQTKYLLLRPFLHQFFAKLQGHFEMVAFSNQEKIIADQIIDGLEKSQCKFDYRLYKEHLSIKEGLLQKDITKLGRENERILLIDVQANAPGVCKIVAYVGGKKDRSLLTLADRLKAFAREQASDISNMGSIVGSLQDIAEQNEQSSLSLTIDLKDRLHPTRLSKK